MIGSMIGGSWNMQSPTQTSRTGLRMAKPWKIRRPGNGRLSLFFRRRPTYDTPPFPVLSRVRKRTGGMGRVVVSYASGILADRLPAHGTIIGMESRRQAEEMLTEDPGTAGNNNNVEAIND